MECNTEAYQLPALYNISRALNSITDMDTLLNFIIHKAKELLDVEGASIILWDQEEDELYFPTVAAEEDKIKGRLKQIHFPTTLGIAGWVFREGQSVIVPDVSMDWRFYREIDENTKFVTRSVLCVPLRSKGRMLGVLEAVNKKEGEFTADDQVLLEAIADNIAVSIERTDLYHDLQKAEELLRRQNTELRQTIEALQVEIAERTRVEEELRESEEKLKRIIESSPDAITVTDLNGNIIECNQQTMNLHGFSMKEELIGRNSLDLIAPKDRQRATEDMERALKQGLVKDLEYIFLAKDGREFPAEASANVVRDSSGEPTSFVGITKDITERRRAEEALKKAYSELSAAHEELKEMQQELIQSEKLAALGKFSSGIAHEVKNPLAIILTGIELLEMKLPNANTDIKTLMGTVKEATLRADRILRNLLTFSKPSKLNIEKIKPDDLISDTISLIEYKASLVNVKIRTQFSEEEPYIAVDRNQMEQVLFNLLMNAVEAIDGSGEIRIKIYRTSLPGHLSGQSCCVIEIADTGEGISKDDLSKILEPFFTTKKDGKGTGLGLSVSKMIIDNHGGDLVIESELGKGTNAKIVLPLA